MPNITKEQTKALLNFSDKILNELERYICSVTFYYEIDNSTKYDLRNTTRYFQFVSQDAFTYDQFLGVYQFYVDLNELITDIFAIDEDINESISLESARGFVRLLFRCLQHAISFQNTIFRNFSKLPQPGDFKDRPIKERPIRALIECGTLFYQAKAVVFTKKEEQMESVQQTGLRVQ